MGIIKKIANEETQKALLSTTRQYFIGNLEKPQELAYFRSKELEIGISSYQNDSYELPHKHQVATEYQYVITGYTEYLDVDTNIVYTFKQGDFYVIEPLTTYVQKVSANTSILFVKVPSINDKEKVKLTEEIKRWLNL